MSINRDLLAELITVGLLFTSVIAIAVVGLAVLFLLTMPLARFESGIKARVMAARLEQMAEDLSRVSRDEASTVYRQASDLNQIVVAQKTLRQHWLRGWWVSPVWDCLHPVCFPDRSGVITREKAY